MDQSQSIETCSCWNEIKSLEIFESLTQSRNLKNAKRPLERRAFATIPSRAPARALVANVIRARTVIVGLTLARAGIRTLALIADVGRSRTIVIGLTRICKCRSGPQKAAQH
jgi:hypothetical protein